MRDNLRRHLKHRGLEPARFLADHALSLVTGRGPRARLLVVSDGGVYTSEQQLAPLRTYRARLRDELGVVFAHMLLADALALPATLRGFDAVLFKLGFRTPRADALAVARTFREAAGARARLVYMDGDDDLCVLWPELLPIVDLYVKKHVFRDSAEHTRPRIGKTNLTDYVSRTFGTSFDDDIIPTSHGVPEEHLGKIVLGWNIALDDKIRSLHRSTARVPNDAEKDVDVVCRATVSEEAWIYPLRAAILPALRRLAPRYRVLTPETKVPEDVYYGEMRRSRVCVSPFGYGEICWRDFEAILSGCLLVKPDVGHVLTEPDIFVPYETYVPVRWDFADLEDVLVRYLDDPRERLRIASNARRVLTDYYERGGFEASFARVLGAAGIDLGRARA